MYINSIPSNGTIMTAKTAHTITMDTTPSASSDSAHFRPMHCELNALTRADGSALFTQGDTAVMASVYGPIEGRPQHQHIDKAYVDVHYRPKAGQASVTDRLVEQIVRQTCETALLTVLHPRTAITVQLQEMEDRGGLVAASLNAAVLALLQSGIAMRFLVAAVHCAVAADGSTLLLDPCARRLAADGGSRAQLTFVFDSVAGRTVAVHTAGRYSVAQYNDAQRMCAAASAAVFAFYREAVAKFAKVL